MTAKIIPFPRKIPCAICAWCDSEIAPDRVCHDGTDVICPTCMAEDCDRLAWDSERLVMWHELLAPFIAVFGKKSARCQVERLLPQKLSFSVTFAILSELHWMLKARKEVMQMTDEQTKKIARAENALHETRRLMRRFLKLQHEDAQ